MATEYYPGDDAKVFYAKPLPLVTSPWADDVVAFTAIAGFDEHTGDIDITKDYRVYVRLGATPAASDAAVGADGSIPKAVATPAQVAAITSVTVVPLTGVVQARTDGTTISVFVAETVTVSIAVVDAEGTAVDVSAMTLTLLVERTDGTDVSTVANADITKSSSTISFAIPSAVSANEGNYRWTLRQATGNAVLMSGPLIVAYATQAD